MDPFFQPTERFYFSPTMSMKTYFFQWPGHMHMPKYLPLVRTLHIEHKIGWYSPVNVTSGLTKNRVKGYYVTLYINKKFNKLIKLIERNVFNFLNKIKYQGMGHFLMGTWFLNENPTIDPCFRLYSRPLNRLYSINTIIWKLFFILNIKYYWSL